LKTRRIRYVLLFAAVWAPALAAGYGVSHVIGYVHTDAMSRVANAFYVLYSRDPHLGAIGFVWTPLPSLVELVFLLFYPLYPPLASSGLAGVLMSSLFAGLSAVLLARAADEHGLPPAAGVGIALLFAFNPFMFLFGMNGLSDAPFMFFAMYATVHLTRWLKEGGVGHLVKIGAALALAFWTRYEAVPFGFAVGLAAALAIWRGGGPPGETRRERLHRLESTLIVVWLPIVFSGVLWIALNGIIMGNPLYFLNSEYSNAEQSAVLATDANFRDLIGHPLNSLLFVLRKTAWFSLPLLVIVPLKLLRRRTDAGMAGADEPAELAGLLLMILSVAALQFLLLVSGHSYGWFRYFMYGFPIAAAWLPYELGKWKRRKLPSAAAFASLAASAALLGTALFDPAIAPDENKMPNAREHAALIDVDRVVARYLDEELGDAVILMDSYTAFYVILNSRRPERYLITSDFGYRETLENPPAGEADYILTPKPNPSSALSAENRLYPGFYEKGAEWTELHKEFGDESGGLWRLYRIIKADGETEEKADDGTEEGAEHGTKG